MRSNPSYYKVVVVPIAVVVVFIVDIVPMLLIFVAVDIWSRVWLIESI